MALQNCIKTIKGDIVDILQSGNYYVTEEIARELFGINNALEHMALDTTFLSTSQEWRKKPGNYSEQCVNEQMAGAMSAVNQVGNGLYSYKNRLAKRNVIGKQENELRELHQWAVSSLCNAQQCLEPFSMSAADRIKQFGDTIGVTDRYTGYRANLTRGNRDPFKLETSWMDKQGEQGLMNSLRRSKTTLGPCRDQRVTFDNNSFGAVPSTKLGPLQRQVTFGDVDIQPQQMVSIGNRTCNTLYPKAPGAINNCGSTRSSVMDEVKALNSLNACDYFNKSNASSRPKTAGAYLRMSVQEQAGINTDFPGKSEYMHRFKSPVSDMPTPDFKINPTPNFAVYGRPMQTAKYVPSFTEYQTRYEWPDAEKIVKMPWLRN